MEVAPREEERTFAPKKVAGAFMRGLGERVGFFSKTNNLLGELLHREEEYYTRKVHSSHNLYLIIIKFLLIEQKKLKITAFSHHSNYSFISTFTTYQLTVRLN